MIYTQCIEEEIIEISQCKNIMETNDETIHLPREDEDNGKRNLPI